MQNRTNFEELKIDEEEAKKFIRLGIKGEIEFEVMNNQRSHYQVLDERQLNELNTHHPKKKKIRLTEGFYNRETHRLESFGYEQSINFEDLWFDEEKFEAILEKYPHYSKNGIALTKEEKLQTSPYWRRLTKLTLNAIEEYPQWKKEQKIVHITSNLMEWLKKLGANTREADIIKNILSDLHEELQ